MKRFLILMLCVAAFSACSEEKMSTGDGRNPLADFVLSESATPGDEAVIQWNGFTKPTEVVLVDASGQEYQAQVKTMTSSGLIFTVPAGLEPGDYTVCLKQDSNVTVGILKVLEPEMPVSGISYPSAVSPGDVFIFGGVGIGSSFNVVLSSADKTYTLESKLSPSGLECNVPKNIKSGVYNLILTDGTNEWPITSSFTVMFKKTLVAVVSDGPYNEGIRSSKEYRIEKDEDGEVVAIVYRSFRHEGGVVDPETESIDRYVKLGEGEYAVEDGDMSSLNFGFKYTFDGDGMIVSADVHRYSNKTPEGIHRIFTWVYNAEGLPTAVEFELSGKIYSLQDYIYDEDYDLLETNARTFVYDDETLLNKEYGPDVAHAFDMMHYTDEPFLYVPFLLGEHPHRSPHLPDGYMKISGPTSMTKVPFTYEYDTDGYVKKVSWGGTGADASSITFEYQD